MARGEFSKLNGGAGGGFGRGGRVNSYNRIGGSGVVLHIPATDVF